MIFIAVFCNVEPMALVTLIRSNGVSVNMQYRSAVRCLPISVFGVAKVTSKHHDSQHTSSSPFPNHPSPPPFFFLFSKNSTTREPRMLLLGDEVEVNCLINCPTRVSIRVPTSGSGMRGKVKSRMSRYEGRMGEKYRWKQIVCKMPGRVSPCFLVAGVNDLVPRTISLTQVGSANTSSIYCGGFRASIAQEADSPFPGMIDSHSKSIEYVCHLIDHGYRAVDEAWACEPPHGASAVPASVTSHTSRCRPEVSSQMTTIARLAPIETAII